MYTQDNTREETWSDRSRLSRMHDSQYVCIALCGKTCCSGVGVAQGYDVLGYRDHLQR